MTRLSVVVPSYRRPDLLRQCLAGLAGQQHPLDQVVVVHRRDDAATAAVAAQAPGVTACPVDLPGVLAALHAGSRLATGDVLAFTDDDAVPYPDWSARLLRHFADPTVGGVGGRDVVQPLRDEPLVPSVTVGAVSAWGRHRGEHDRGEGPPADVDVLKGVNMAFRREALALPAALRGAGAQVHYEIAASLWAREQGWRLVYDPAVRVDHHLGPRYDNDQRGRPDATATHDEAYNLVVALLGTRPGLTARRAAYGLLVGDRASPGLVRAAAAVLQRQDDVPRKLVPSLRGQVRALRDTRRGAGLALVGPGPGPGELVARPTGGSGSGSP